MDHSKGWWMETSPDAVSCRLRAELPHPDSERPRRLRFPAASTRGRKGRRLNTMKGRSIKKCAMGGPPTSSTHLLTQHPAEGPRSSIQPHLWLDRWKSIKVQPQTHQTVDQTWISCLLLSGGEKRQHQHRKQTKRKQIYFSSRKISSKTQDPNASEREENKNYLIKLSKM